MTDLEPVFSYQNELVVDVIESMFQFNARRIFHENLYEVDKRFFENYWSVMSAILHGVTVICYSQEMWQFFVMTTVATNISAEPLNVYVQCLVFSLEYLTFWRRNFLLNFSTPCI
jgi:hypothetical protein